MRTSLLKIQKIEKYIHGQLPPEDNILWDARQVLNPQLKEEVIWQQKAYDVITAKGRADLKNELEDTFQKKMSKAGFRERIMNLFTKSK
ncbi:hypothetical protein [Fulvivirga ligni]|uniref:hypothetical protein n=1 Tax=Fulvivirga ligni TaxID=2904246 RepID=UPI001F3DD310|nr:hypothetical protein [Fulvivirga ligni]UII22118.1 hypothetical protein LVD16_02595 [Fulvivirga ligni]